MDAIVVPCHTPRTTWRMPLSCRMRPQSGAGTACRSAWTSYDITSDNADLKGTWKLTRIAREPPERELRARGAV
jgi:hypothetical protein